MLPLYNASQTCSVSIHVTESSPTRPANTGWASSDRAADLKSSAVIVLHRHGRIVIMEACRLSSRRRVATTACAVLLTPGIVG